MTSSAAVIATMALYMAVCLLLGLVAYRRTLSLGDFILGGRSLGSYVTAFSAQATDMSGWLLMGLPGLAYASGFDAAWMALGLTAGTYLNWKLVAKPLRGATERLGDALTLPEYFARRFADDTRVLRTVCALFILIFFTFYTSSGFVAAGRLFESLFGLEYGPAMFWGSIAMLAYTFLGGFLAVSWSDVLQASLMIVALVLVAALGIALTGGPGMAIDRLNAVDATLLDPLVGDGGAALGWIGIASLAGWGLGYPGQPHILARFMAARSEQTVTAARRVAMAWVIVALGAAVVVGLTAVVVLPDRLAGAEREKAFIIMATTFFPPAVAGICLAGVMAAIMSTASAQLLVASAAFAEDLYKGLLRRDAGRAELLWTGRAAVVAIAALAFVLALNPASTVLDLVSWAWAGFGAAFGPTIVLSLYWPRMTRAGAIAGIVTGGLTVIVWRRLADYGGIFTLYELVPGFVLSWLAVYAATLASAPSRIAREAASK